MTTPTPSPDATPDPDATPTPPPDLDPAGTSGTRGTSGPGVADERVVRAVLSRAVEPGDEHAGRWLRRYGAVGFLDRLLGSAGGAATGDDPFPGTGQKRVASWRLRATAADPGRDLATVQALGGRFVIPGDTEWPRQLDDLGDARPLGLWVRGPADLRTWALRSVALVGARACTPYGAHTAADLATGLARQGWVVVSGAAYGIDGAAHRGALAAGGATVAVLACGVDTPYPRGHDQLIRRVAEQGLVVGELPPESHPTPSRFILRNRVIAALTRGTVVIEAQHRSGSLVTARAAARLGRHTMGVPGPVTSALSAGVHELLRGDATLVTDADEIIELVGDMGQLAPARRGPVLPRDLLAPATAQVLEAVPARGPTPTTVIARRAGGTPDDTLAKLYELHSLGFVERRGDGWQLTNTTTPPSNARRGGP
ncbi:MULTISPECIES: DNA-processing protein DprA [Streptomyces]|uniref:Nucleotide binding protein Smf n=1 Tax=Streptomyces venezuelae (strain ATCC 10712 / CBS 650.69 / DSM 40230 / JCM 4526 / NBRC 13096 / PD 04745) TaxID=953739 RepID=F2R5I1_STRVP|nr:DNA-processing protein DprA [Streptomyces venezuelae]APE24177.1 DNA protecting protein DprA [Streptomyces venezuelae]QES01548.1 DNA-protecting protein DprA [Streptomyces venezuelae ATCC 10712]CCA58585.1 Nucleotide binding protein Smf [Streptomyces venezuelae ATCC 10712]